MAFSTVTLSGTYRRVDGAPASGSVTIVPSVPTLSASGGPILAGRLTVPLDAAGSFTVDLPATDDDALTPTGFTYAVVPSLRHSGSRPVTVALPAAAGAVDMADVQQAS